MRSLFVALLLFVALPTFAYAGAPVDVAPLKKWVESQDRYRSMSSEFKQTRILSTLRTPLSSPGRLWFSAPGSIRWELGEPAKTVIVKKPGSVLVISPAKKRAERHAGAMESLPESAQAAMSLLQFPIAKNYAEFQQKFEVQALSSQGTIYDVSLALKDPEARKMVTLCQLQFDSSTNMIRKLSLEFRDGSALRNEFSEVRLNPKIDPSIFEYDLTGFEVKDAKR